MPLIIISAIASYGNLLSKEICWPKQILNGTSFMSLAPFGIALSVPLINAGITGTPDFAAKKPIPGCGCGDLPLILRLP